MKNKFVLILAAILISVVVLSCKQQKSAKDHQGEVVYSMLVIEKNLAGNIVSTTEIGEFNTDLFTPLPASVNWDSLLTVYGKVRLVHYSNCDWYHYPLNKNK